MFVTPLPIVTLVSPLQPENASDPMLVTGYPPSDDGIVIAPVVAVGTAVADDEPPPIEAAPFDTLYVQVMPFTVSVAASECNAPAHAMNEHRITPMIRFISLLLSLTRF